MYHTELELAEIPTHLVPELHYFFDEPKIFLVLLEVPVVFCQKMQDLFDRFDHFLVPIPCALANPPMFPLCLYVFPIFIARILTLLAIHRFYRF